MKKEIFGVPFPPVDETYEHLVEPGIKEKYPLQINLHIDNRSRKDNEDRDITLFTMAHQMKNYEKSLSPRLGTSSGVSYEDHTLNAVLHFKDPNSISHFAKNTIPENVALEYRGEVFERPEDYKKKADEIVSRNRSL